VSWDDVGAAVALVNDAYSALLKSREDDHALSHDRHAAEDRWLVTLEARRAALDAHWTEEDGEWEPGARSYGRVLQRYYAETEPERKAAAEALKAAKKAAKKEED
jgi:hypothetical protein